MVVLTWWWWQLRARMEQRAGEILGGGLPVCHDVLMVLAKK
jgi:hypothetical protein